MRVAYVTAGTVGFGDTAKGISLRRALARRNSSVDLRVFAPQSQFPVTQSQGVVVVDVDAAALLDPGRALGSNLGAAVAAFAPDLVVLGQFWAPVHHLIAAWGAPAWLLLRAAPAQWTQGFPGMPFDPKRFARIVAIEPVELAHVRERIDPIVLANADDAGPLLPTPLSSRAALGVVAVHAGLPGELEQLVARSPKPVTTRFDLRDQSAPFPVCLLLAADAEHVVCGAGYNSYWEARWLHYASRTTFVPFARNIDDQAWRVTACADFVPKENGADVLARWIDAG